MTLSMPKARLVMHGIVRSTIVTAKDYEPKSGQALRCLDLRCGARLGHVQAHPRNGRDTNAYFRRAQGSEHSPTCRFNVDGTVRRLVAGSQSLDKYAGILGASPDGHSIVRLNILFDALNGRILRYHPDGEAIPGDRIGAEFVTGDRQLLPYLRRARAIVALIARLGGADELRDNLRIRYEGHDFRWDDFFYGPGELDRLFRYLRQRHENGQARHPVAVVVDPLTSSGRLERNKDIFVGCKYKSIEALTQGDLRISPLLICKRQSLAQDLSERGAHLVCGIPRPKLDAFELFPGRGEIENAKIYIIIFSRNQYARWSH
ncbi:MAG: hypothetical protein PGN25_06265 [Methylorubrum populi]